MQLLGVLLLLAASDSAGAHPLARRGESEILAPLWVGGCYLRRHVGWARRGFRLLADRPNRLSSAMSAAGFAAYIVHL